IALVLDLLDLVSLLPHRPLRREHRLHQRGALAEFVGKHLEVVVELLFAGDEREQSGHRAEDCSRVGVPLPWTSMNSSVLALILGGGQGTRLFPLTQHRSKPAVPIGGKYRLIDIPISNCLHADIRRIFVLTQFNSASLNRHISQSYRMDLFSQGFVEILAAEAAAG